MSNNHEVYLCEPKESCMGDTWARSVCQAPRTAFMCMDCPDGMNLNGNLKEETDQGFTSVSVVPAPIVAFRAGLLTVSHSKETLLDGDPLILEN